MATQTNSIHEAAAKVPELNELKAEMTAHLSAIESEFGADQVVKEMMMIQSVTMRLVDDDELRLFFHHYLHATDRIYAH